MEAHTVSLQYCAPAFPVGQEWRDATGYVQQAATTPVLLTSAAHQGMSHRHGLSRPVCECVGAAT